jgi:hypothetical protein
MIKIEQLLNTILGFLSTKTVTPMFGSAAATTGTILPCTKLSIINNGGANCTITSNGTSYTLEPNETITLDPGSFRRNEKVTFDVSASSIKYIYYK